MPRGSKRRSRPSSAHGVRAEAATASAPAVSPKLVYAYEVRNGSSGRWRRPCRIAGRS